MTVFAGSERGYGCIPDTPDRRDFRAHPTTTYAGPHIDLAAGFAPHKDQGQLGACVAFGCCAVLDYARRAQGLPPVDTAELFTYWAARSRAGLNTGEDTGLQIRDGIKSLAKDGVPPAPDWPYDTTKFTQKPPNQAWADATHNEAVAYGRVAAGDIDNMIAGQHPVVLGFKVFESFESEQVTRTGVMPIPGAGESPIGGHCVVLVSTPFDGSLIPAGVPGLLYRRARNSWGEDWGYRGDFWFPLGAMRYASDCWQVTTAGDPNPPTPPPAPTPAPTAEDVALAAAARNWLVAHHL